MTLRFAITYHKNNIAGKNIVERFKKLAYAPQVPIVELKKETIYSENLNEKNYPELKNIDFLIFASTHRSEKGSPSLCLHAPGNWRSADLGGQAGKICPTSALFLKQTFEKLKINSEKYHLKDYDITLECTHHGPLINKPCMFIEIGSQEEQWKDRKAGFVIAKTIIEIIDEFKENPYNEVAIGIGGPHYCPNFNKIQLNSNIALSHIIPQYILPASEDMIRQAINNTEEEVDFALLDWKGLGNSEQRKQITDILDKLYVRYKRTSEVGK